MFRVAQADSGERYVPVLIRHNRGAFSVWTAALALILGLIAFESQQEWLLSWFQAIALLAIGSAFILTLNTWRDPFNPLCLIIAAGFVRFLVPGALILSDVELSEDVSAVFNSLKLSDYDWQWGWSLALMGLSGVVLGWLLVQGEVVEKARLKLQVVGNGWAAGLVGCFIGALALVAFVISNASLGVILTGGFRGTVIQVGSGKFFFLAYMLIAGSALLTCDFLNKGRGWISLAPVLIAGLLYGVLGGRARSMTPIAAGLLLLWYFKRDRASWPKIKIAMRYVVLLPVVIAGALWLSYVGLLYRGEFGAKAISEALSVHRFWQHLQSSIFTDLGQLHALAGAVAIGPGVLNGDTFYGALSWPLNSVLPIPGRSAGVFIVEELAGFGKNQERWGVNASLIGDAYLNFGLPGVAVVTLLLGVVLKILYLKFRDGSLHSAIYCLALLSAVQAFWVSIDVWPQALSTVSFTGFLIWLGNTVLRVTRAPT